MVAMEASCFFNLFLLDSIIMLDVFHPLWEEYLSESLICDFVLTNDSFKVFADQSNYFVFGLA